MTFGYTVRMQQDELISGLQSLGLTEKESRIYVALLQQGRASAYAVARKAGVKRPTTYVLLEEMRERGFVSLIPRAKKKLYVAEAPEGLVTRFEEHVSHLKSLLPTLQALTRRDTSDVQTLYYEGINGVRDAFFYRHLDIRNTELVGFYAAPVSAPEELTNVFAEWREYLRRHSVTVRGIAPKHSSLREVRKYDAVYGRTIREVPYEQYSASISMDAGDTFVRIVAYRDLQAVIIENPEVCRTFRQIFEMVWSSRE